MCAFCVLTQGHCIIKKHCKVLVSDSISSVVQEPAARDQGGAAPGVWGGGGARLIQCVFSARCRTCLKPAHVHNRLHLSICKPAYCPSGRSADQLPDSILTLTWNICCRRWGGAPSPNDARAAAKTPPARRSATPASAPSDGVPAAPQPATAKDAADTAGPAPDPAPEAGSKVTAHNGQDAAQQSGPKPAASRGDWDDLAAPPSESQPSPPSSQPPPAAPVAAALPAPEQVSSSAEVIAPQQQSPEQPPQQQPEAGLQLEADPGSEVRAATQASEKPDQPQSDTASVSDAKASVPQTEVLTARSSEGGISAPPQPQPAPSAPSAQTVDPPRLPPVSAHLPPPTAQLPVVFPSDGRQGGVVFSPVPGVSQRPTMTGAQHPPPVTLPAGELSVRLQQFAACNTCIMRTMASR